MPAIAIEKPTPSFGAISILAAEEAGASPNISIYLAPHRAGSGTRQGSVRLHAILNRIREEMPDGPDRDDLLGPLAHLEHDPDLHAGHADGFAIFRSPRALRAFRLPGWEGVDTVFRQRHFQILPMLGHLASHAPFQMLALTRKAVRLFEIGRSGLAEVHWPPTLVPDFKLFMGFDQPDHKMSNRITTRTGTVGFGTGSEREKEHRHFHDFCRAIDHAIVDMGGGAARPLVVAGTQHDVTIYVAASAHPLLVEDSVFSSPDDGSPVAELADRARTIVARWEPPEHRRLSEQYRKRAGTHLASAELKAIAAAASTGRVEHLFVAAGTVAEDANAVACDTLLHSGTVSVTPVEAMPDTVTVAALLRY